MPGNPDWGGTPQVHGTEEVLIANIANIAPGGSQQHVISVTRPGYIVEIHAWNQTDTVTLLPVAVEMRWQDTVSTNGIDTQLWQFLAGTTAQPHYVDGKGPTSGGTLVLTVFNNAAAGPSLSYFIIVDETSAAPVRHDWRTDDIFFFAIAGSLVPGHDAVTDILAFRNAVNLAVNTPDIRSLPLYNGLVQLHADTSLANATLQITIKPAGGSGAEISAVVYFATTDATGNLNAQVYLPRTQCSITINNAGAGAATVNYCVVAGER